MKIVQYILYLVLIAFHETLFRNLTGIQGVTINLPAIIVLTVALYRSELAAVWFGFLVGVVMSAGNPEAMGWNALVLSVLAVLAFHARERLNLDSFAAKLIVLIGGVAVHNVVTILVNRQPEFVYQLWRLALTGTVYTGVVATIFLSLLEGRATGRRTRMLS
jgi:rod shape-determining protein MreD